MHGVGLVFAAVDLRPETPLVPLDERLSYLASPPLGWSLGWGVWMLAALALVAFLALLARHRLERSEMTGLAVILASAGAAIDLFCDTVYITVLPMIAAEPAAPAALFLAVERAAGAGASWLPTGLVSV